MARKKKPIEKQKADSQDRGPANGPSSAAEMEPTPAADPGAGSESRPDAAFPIVGIGASAGGLAAFEAFFSGMPAEAD